MQNYAVTSLIGGSTPGSYSSDIFYMDHSGEFLDCVGTLHPLTPTIGNFVLNDGGTVSV